MPIIGTVFNSKDKTTWPIDHDVFLVIQNGQKLLGYPGLQEGKYYVPAGLYWLTDGDRWIPWPVDFN